MKGEGGRDGRVREGGNMAQREGRGGGEMEGMEGRELKEGQREVARDTRKGGWRE